MHIPHMEGSKVTNHIFDILPRSRDILAQSFIVNWVGWPFKKALVRSETIAFHAPAAVPFHKTKFN